MPRALEVIQADLGKVERERSTEAARPSREDVEHAASAWLAGLRGAAGVPPPEAVASGSAPGGRDMAAAFGAYVALHSSEARSVLAAYVQVQVRAALSAKDKAKRLSGLDRKVRELREEAREAELAAMRADLDRRTERFKAERQAEENAARGAAA